MSEETNPQAPNELPEPPKYHFKWMLALLFIVVAARFIFEWIKQAYS